MLVSLIFMTGLKQVASELNMGHGSSIWAAEYFVEFK